MGVEKLRNGELNDLYYSIKIIWVMKSSGMMWTVHVARLGKSRVI